MTTNNNISYVVGGTENNISWSVSDVSMTNPTYTIYRDGNPIMFDVRCNADEQILIPIDGLDAGIYIYIIEVDDGYGESCTEIITVTVNTQEEKTNFTPYIITFIIGLSLLASAAIHGFLIRSRPINLSPKDKSTNIHPSDLGSDKNENEN